MAVKYVAYRFMACRYMAIDRCNLSVTVLNSVRTVATTVSDFFRRSELGTMQAIVHAEWLPGSEPSLLASFRVLLLIAHCVCARTAGPVEATEALRGCSASGVDVETSRARLLQPKYGNS
jgi:hypothetical protein